MALVIALIPLFLGALPAPEAKAFGTFRQVHRINSLSMKFITDTFAPKNAIGTAISGGTAQSQVQTSIQNAVQDGSLSILLDMPGIDDLTGTNAPGFQLGLTGAAPLIPAGNPATYSGASDLDWWYVPDATQVDANGQALSQTFATISAKIMQAGPARGSFLTGALFGAVLNASDVYVGATTGSSTSPLASSNGFPPGHLPTEQIDPSLSSFATMQGALRGNISAASLDASPVPASLLAGGLTSCSQGYTSANTLLDLFVSGCTILFVQQIKPTQPDSVDTQAAGASAGDAYVFTVNGGTKRVNGCTRNGVPSTLAQCKDAAAYSAYYGFTSDRVIRTLGTHTLTVGVPANGSVTGIGISCPGDCTELAMHGTSLNVTAVPPGGYALSQWTGCDTVQGATCTVVMNADRTVSATMAPLATIPGAPTALGAVAAIGQATISFSPPGSDGGSAITSYTASCTPGPMSASGAASPIVVTGLTNGQPYGCSVTATNAVGMGPASNTVQVTPGAPPAITSAPPPNGVLDAPYAFAYLASGAPNPAFSLSSGALPPGLSLSANGQLAGTPTTAGVYSGVVTAANGVGSPATQAFTITIANPRRLFGISTRTPVLTGDNVLIGGLIVGGTQAKTIVVRARGPSLGVTGALADPVLTLVPADGSPPTTNDDWQSAPNATQLATTGFQPGSAKESAIMATLNPGAYTAIVSGAGNTTGISLVEAYELDHADVPLTGISTRGRVETGDNVMIGGFIIEGDGPKTVVVRARGPSLGVAGALADPTLTVVPGNGSPAIVNDDWQSAANATQLQSTGLQPANAKESALLLTLDPGAYTAVVSGVGGTTGVAIVEVYAVD